ncbi:MAG: hypothetical protein QOI95_2016 [Acidimicrobiaceae bacterium]|jgi:hypothetical protein
MPSVKLPDAFRPAERWRQLVGRMPPEVLDELKTSARRLTSVRKPRDLLSVLETEVGRLSRVVVPTLARHPLPVRGRRSAELLAATAAGAAAAFVELDELAVLFTEGVAAPTVPAAGASLLGAFVIEVWISVSLRVHQIEAAGRDVDMDLLASEVNSAILDMDMTGVKQLSTRVAAAVGKRVARRWVGALAPGVGIFIDGVAARRTVTAISRMPVEAHPPSSPRPTDSIADIASQTSTKPV